MNSLKNIESVVSRINEENRTDDNEIEEDYGRNESFSKKKKHVRINDVVYNDDDEPTLVRTSLLPFISFST